MKKLLSIAVMLPVILATSPQGLAQDKSQGQDQAQGQAQYTPQAVFCADPKTPNTLCPVLASYLGPDSRLAKSFGYPGLYGPPPTSASEDLQTPFDNMAWQMFVALNWARNASGQPPAQGLAGRGLRVWQTYPKVAALFGNSPVRAPCTSTLALPTFTIGSDGNGNPAPNNEEYFQASTNLPLVDINDNWTIFERRVNDIEASYLRAPNGQKSQTLTTLGGQKQFIAKQSERRPVHRVGDRDQRHQRIDRDQGRLAHHRSRRRRRSIALLHHAGPDRGGGRSRARRPAVLPQRARRAGRPAHHPAQSGLSDQRRAAAAMDLGDLRACR